MSDEPLDALPRILAWLLAYFAVGIAGGTVMSMGLERGWSVAVVVVGALGLTVGLACGARAMWHLHRA